MAEILKGAPVTAALNEKMTAEVTALKEQGVVPTLAILRVGERKDDLSYETGAMKQCAAVGVEVRNVVLPADVCQEDFDVALEQLNTDDSVHGILMFRPLPKQLDSERARQMLNPAKDVDGCTDGSWQVYLPIRRLVLHRAQRRRQLKSWTIMELTAPANGQRS